MEAWFLRAGEDLRSHSGDISLSTFKACREGSVLGHGVISQCVDGLKVIPNNELKLFLHILLIGSSFVSWTKIIKSHLPTLLSSYLNVPLTRVSFYFDSGIPVRCVCADRRLVSGLAHCYFLSAITALGNQWMNALSCSKRALGNNMDENLAQYFINYLTTAVMVLSLLHFFLIFRLRFSLLLTFFFFFKQMTCCLAPHTKVTSLPMHPLG